MLILPRLWACGQRVSWTIAGKVQWSPLQNALTRDSLGFSENVSRRCRAVISANPP